MPSTDDIYFTPEHRAFRDTVRRFVRAEMAPYVDAWEAAGGFPRALYRRCGEVGLFGLGHPEAVGGTPSADIFHLLIFTEELVAEGRCGGLAATLMATYIGTPPIRRMGTPEQQQRFLPKVIRGEWVAALGITEPDAGSDVAGIRTRRAFGGPLADKQVIRHMLADMATRVDVAREYVYRIAYRFEHGDECITEVSMAKNVAYDAARDVIDAAVQIHGGLGFMTGTVVERLYRDNRVLGIGGGTREIMNEIIARRLLP